MIYSADYAKPLRTIGQALEALHVKDIDIESQGNDYLVRGKIEAHLLQPAPREHNHENKLRMIWAKLRGKKANGNGDSQIASSPIPFEFRYTPEDVERLEQEGQARRNNTDGMPNNHSVSQILRTVGGYVETRRARFVGVSWKEQSITIQYEKSDGHKTVEEMSVSSLYDYCIHMYMQRSGRKDLTA
jgi:hypothetical protein